MKKNKHNGLPGTAEINTGYNNSLNKPQLRLLRNQVSHPTQMVASMTSSVRSGTDA